MMLWSPQAAKAHRRVGFCEYYIWNSNACVRSRLPRIRRTSAASKSVGLTPRAGASRTAQRAVSWRSPSSSLLIVDWLQPVHWRDQPGSNQADLVL